MKPNVIHKIIRRNLTEEEKKVLTDLFPLHNVEERGVKTRISVYQEENPHYRPEHKQNMSNSVKKKFTELEERIDDLENSLDNNV